MDGQLSRIFAVQRDRELEPREESGVHRGFVSTWEKRQHVCMLHAEGNGLGDSWERRWEGLQGAALLPYFGVPVEWVAVNSRMSSSETGDTHSIGKQVLGTQACAVWWRELVEGLSQWLLFYQWHRSSGGRRMGKGTEDLTSKWRA